jgi:hypothetical protein
MAEQKQFRILHALNSLWTTICPEEQEVGMCDNDNIGYAVQWARTLEKVGFYVEMKMELAHPAPYPACFWVDIGIDYRDQHDKQIHDERAQGMLKSALDLLFKDMDYSSYAEEILYIPLQKMVDDLHLPYQVKKVKDRYQASKRMPERKRKI